MANEKNLIPVTQRSQEEAKAISSKGGKARQAQVKRNKTFQELAQEMLNMTIPEKYKLKIKEAFPELDTDKATGKMVMIARQYQKAVAKGDSKAFEVLRDTAGEKPVEQIVNTNTNTNIDLSKLTTKQLEKLSKISDEKLTNLIDSKE